MAGDLFRMKSHNVLAQMCIFLPFSGKFSVYLRPNVYIHVQMSILMSNGSIFLWVIRVLQTVGPQIRVVGARKWSGCSNLSIISVI